MIIDALQCSNWDRELFEELRAGQVTAVHITCAIWEGARETLNNVSQWYERIRKNDDILLLATTTADIERAQRENKTAIVLGFQNASPFEDDLALVEIFYRLGVRIVQLTYNIQNHLGASCYEPYDSGLTRYGREIVREMNRLGMLIDLSHVGEKTSLDAIAASERPVAVTHANPSFFHHVKRSKSNKVLEALAANGGMIGCSLYPHLIGGRDVTQHAFFEMLARTVDMMGIDHVGIGSDSVRKCTAEYLQWMRMGRWTRTVDYGAGSADLPGWPEWQPWFQSPADFPQLQAGLIEFGFSPEEAAKLMGVNWYRFWQQYWPD